jgi:cytoskeletal protein CcmA (bactofilin family)
MGFFSDLKEDLSQAVNELLPDESNAGTRESRYKTLAEFQENPDFSKLMVFPNEEEDKKSPSILTDAQEEAKRGSKLEFSLENANESIGRTSLEFPGETGEPEWNAPKAEESVWNREQANAPWRSEETYASKEASRSEFEPELASRSEFEPELTFQNESESEVTFLNETDQKAAFPDEQMPKVAFPDEQMPKAAFPDEPESIMTKLTEPTEESVWEEKVQVSENTLFAATKTEEGREKAMDLDEMLNDALAGGRLGGEAVDEQADGAYGMGEKLDETAIITGGMTLTGDVSSQGSMDVQGMINGNLDILGKLNVTGCINGNSRAAEIYADGAKINGEVSSEGTVKIGASSVIIGNISAKSAVIAGAVKGDIDVMGPVILDTSAIVMGNIKSKSVQINNGAVIEGMCSQCYADVNPTSFFEEYKPEIKKVKIRK